MKRPGLMGFRVRPLAVTLILGTILSLGAALATWRWEQEKRALRFTHEAEVLVGVLRGDIKQLHTKLQGIASLFGISGEVSRPAFRGFVAPYLSYLHPSYHPSIHALGWVPRVAAAERQRYEAAARADGFPDFRITEKNAQDLMVLAGERPEYFPVYYLEPPHGKEKARGYDLASEPTRCQALSLCRDSGAPMATGPIRLVTETGQQKGLLIFWPVYQGSPLGLQEYRTSLRGFALGVFRVGNLITNSFNDLQGSDLKIYLFDKASPAGERLLLGYSLASTRFLEDDESITDPAPLKTGLYFEGMVDVGGRSWTVMVKPDPEGLNLSRVWLPLGVLAAGLGLTVLLSAYLLKRQQVLTSLESLNLELEERVAHRTAEHHDLYKLTRLIVDNVPDLIWSKGMDDKFVLVNQAMCDKLLMIDSPDEALGKTDGFFAEKERQAGFKHTFGEICVDSDAIIKETKTPGRFQESGLIRGQKLVLDVFKTPLFNENGEMIGTVGCGRDVTREKEFEGALQESELRFRTLLEYIPGVAIQGYGPDGIVLYWNKASEKVYGYSAGEAMGKNLGDLIIPPEIKPEFAHALEIGAKTTESGEFMPSREYLLMHKDGSLIPVYSIHAVVCLEDRPPLMFCINVDLSDRKKLEEEHLRLAKLEALGVLAGGIAHDFNNILMGILGNISLAALASSVSGAHERLTAAEAACGQARSLAQQLLTFAKGGAPVKKPQDLKEIVRGAARLALSGSQSRVEFSLPDQLWDVEVDQGQIDQVFSNLFINADQAMPMGGLIQVEAENLEVAEGSHLPLAPRKYVVVTLKDQGTGISPGHLERIFDPYFTTKQKGSGLGLATTFSIITQHGGYIMVDSQLGRGTTFRLYLPAQEGAVLPENPVEAKPLPLGGHGRILVMDDETLVREVVGKMLRSLGYEPVLTQDGQEALELYARGQASGEPFAAVILDLTIPGGMGGMEAIQHLMAQEPQVKAVVSSGYADNTIMADFKAYGFQGVIAKPYRLADLARVLQEVLNT